MWVLSSLRDPILISTPCLPYKQLVVTSSTGPIWVFPWIHPLGCEDPSSLGKMYSRQAFASNCSPLSFVMKYCRISTTCMNPASIKNLLTLFFCESNSISSSYRCNTKFWHAGSSFSKKNFTHHSTHAQSHSWMSSNQLAASIDDLTSHHPSKANAPPIHTSADRSVPQPHLAVLSQLSSSSGPTKKLPWIFMEKVYSTLCLPSIDSTAKVQVFDSLGWRFTIISDPKRMSPTRKRSNHQLKTFCM